MSRNTSVSLGEHFEAFIAGQVEAGRYGNASEVVRAGLRLLEEYEAKVAALRQALEEGIASPETGPLDIQKIKREARKRVSSRHGEKGRSERAG